MTEPVFFNEEWRSVPDFPNYEVSNRGRVRVLRSRRYGDGYMMRPSADSSGRLKVGLSSAKFATTSFTLSALVASVWVPKASQGHKWLCFHDGNANNADADNLYWSQVSPQKRMKRAVGPSRTVKTDIAAFLLTNHGLSVRQLAEKFGVSLSVITHITPGRDYSPRPRTSPSPIVLHTPPADVAVEEWRQIAPGVDISSFGRVKSYRLKKPIILRPQSGTSGYLHTSALGKTKAIHVLVASAFCARQQSQSIVNHIDGNKHNNHVSNLEWVTPGESMRHAYSAGLVPIRRRKGFLPSTDTVLGALNSQCANDVAKSFDVSLNFVLGIRDGMAWSDKSAQRPGERWAKLDGFAVEVSTHGRVRTAKSGLLKLCPRSDGYVAPTLPLESGGYATMRIHRAVLMAFGHPPPTGHVAHHVNHRRDDNRVENLAWVSHSENNKAAHAFGQHPPKPRPTEPVSAAPEGFVETKYKGYFVSKEGVVVSCWRKQPRFLLRFGSKYVRINGKPTPVDQLLADAFGLPDELPKKSPRLRKAPTPHSQRKKPSGVKNKLVGADSVLLQVIAGELSGNKAAKLLGVTHRAVYKAVARLRQRNS